MHVCAYNTTMCTDAHACTPHTCARARCMQVSARVNKHALTRAHVCMHMRTHREFIVAGGFNQHHVLIQSLQWAPYCSCFCPWPLPLFILHPRAKDTGVTTRGRSRQPPAEALQQLPCHTGSDGPERCTASCCSASATLTSCSSNTTGGNCAPRGVIRKCLKIFWVFTAEGREGCC